MSSRVIANARDIREQKTTHHLFVPAPGDFQVMELFETVSDAKGSEVFIFTCSRSGMFWCGFVVEEPKRKTYRRQTQHTLYGPAALFESDGQAYLFQAASVALKTVRYVLSISADRCLWIQFQLATQLFKRDITIPADELRRFLSAFVSPEMHEPWSSILLYYLLNFGEAKSAVQFLAWLRQSLNEEGLDSKDCHYNNFIVGLLPYAWPIWERTEQLAQTKFGDHMFGSHGTCCQPQLMPDVTQNSCR